MLNQQAPYNILVTGGAGFIGSAVIRHLIHDTPHSVINVDKLTYAGNLQSLNSVADHDRYFFEHVDICDAAAIQSIFTQYQPDLIMHLAAESHVDRSIDSPLVFIQTNILGTYTLLEQARHYWNALDTMKKGTFRFHHVSTDEVYGDLINTSLLFTEESAYAPSSPYSASKASADHLVRAWHRTYGLPILITNCSNNYGPHQFLEKFIPVIITHALEGKKIPIYGGGQQIRDWLYVDDHAHALTRVALNGTVGETYNIGSNNERTNLDIALYLCELLDLFAPNKPNGITHYHELINYVDDRPGHDMRYAIDASKIKRELNWMPQVSLDEGLKKTIEWYLSVRRQQ